MIAAQISTILHMAGFKKASPSRSRMGEGYTIRQRMDMVRVDYTPAIDNPARQQDSAEMLSKYRKAIEAAHPQASRRAGWLSWSSYHQTEIRQPSTWPA